MTNFLATRSMTMENKGEECGEAQEKPPYLLITYGTHNGWVGLFDVLESRSRDPDIHILSHKIVMASAHGWILLLDTLNDACSLWKPSSMQIIQLPLLEDRLTYDTCVFTKPPTEPDCYILFNQRKNHKLVYCKIGDEAFRTKILEQQTLLLAVGLFQGRVYGLVRENYTLVSIDFGSEGVELKLNPVFELGKLDVVSSRVRPWYNKSTSCDYLVENCGGDELFLVRKLEFMHCCEFRVFRVDVDKKECVEMEDLGGRTIFVAGNGHGFCVENMKAKGNRIYYGGGDGEFKRGRSLYIFDMEDGTTTSLLPCPGAGRFHSTSCWIQSQPFSNWLPQN